jgi:hypothetical protein
MTLRNQQMLEKLVGDVTQLQQDSGPLRLTALNSIEEFLEFEKKLEKKEEMIAFVSIL